MTVQLDDWVRERFGVRLSTAASPVGWQLTDLVGLALRRNPRRAHLLVSTVLGKHVPADPALIRDVGRLLGALVAQRELGVPLPGGAGRFAAAAGDALAGRSGALRALFANPVADARVAVFGFAETATGLGHCVAEALGASWYLHSTRRQIAEVPVSAGFEEGHSHATSHLIQPAPPSLLHGAELLVLVDDELSTGRTAMAAISEFHRIGPRPKYVIATLVDLRSELDSQAMDEFAAELSCEIAVVALVHGSVELPTGLAAAAAAYIEAQPAATAVARAVSRAGPVVETAFSRVDIGWPEALPEGGRHGFLAADAPGFDRAVALGADLVLAALPAAARRILVIGTEEFMYLPLRLADRIAEAPGREARFQTTTRSPVHAEPAPGYPVRRTFAFTSPEGAVGGDRYVYNVDWRTPGGRPVNGSEPDAVVVVIDQDADRATLYSPAGLLAALGPLGLPMVLAVVAGCRPVALTAAR